MKTADKIKMSAKYLCFNITIYKNMAEEPSCRCHYHEKYIQISASRILQVLSLILQLSIREKIIKQQAQIKNSDVSRNSGHLMSIAN